MRSLQVHAIQDDQERAVPDLGLEGDHAQHVVLGEDAIGKVVLEQRRLDHVPTSEAGVAGLPGKGQERFLGRVGVCARGSRQAVERREKARDIAEAHRRERPLPDSKNLSARADSS